MSYNTKPRKNKGACIFIAILFIAILFVSAFFGVCRDKKDEFKNAELSYLKKDFESASKKFQELANSGDARAQNYLGKMYFNGEGVSQDRDRAVNWFVKSAEQHHPFALRNLAICYLTGRGVPKDMNKALRLELQAASKQKSIRTQLYASLQYGNLAPRSKQQVVTTSARDTNIQGHPVNGLHDDHEAHSKGEERIYKEDEQSLRKLAEKGNVSALYRLGMIYLSGEGVIRDFVAAAHWLSKAAEQGSGDAQFILGNLYAIGRGVHLDYGRAAELYIMAVENKHSMAKCYLAELFSKGVGVNQNIWLARFLCQEGFKESGNSLCVDLWTINNLGETGRPPTDNSSLIDYDAN